MAWIRSKLKMLWIDERGQSTTEYILILAVVVMIAMKFKNSFTSDNGVLTRIIDKLETRIDSFAE